VIGGVPDHAPWLVLKRSPSRAIPDNAGRFNVTGGAAWTTALGSELRNSDPAGSVAVTRERTVDPTSAGVNP